MLQGYRTVIFQLIMFGFAMVHMLAPNAELPDQDKVNQGVDAIMAAITFIWLVGGIIMRYLTKSPIGKKPYSTDTKDQKDEKAPQSNEKGSAHFVLLVAMILVGLVTWGVLLSGCAHKSITQQILDQSDDPATIALATYADAQEAYIASQELYAPYQEVVQATHPDVDKKIIGLMTKANTILDSWQRVGNVTGSQKVLFRLYLRQVALDLAGAMDEHDVNKGVNNE